MSRRPVFSAAEDAPRLDELAAGVGAHLEPEARARVAKFAELVATWTLRVDLVAARSTEDLVEVVALDTLVLAAGDFVPEGARLIDVGAGCGAPTLPLLLLRPDLTATLLEPRRKRVAFLRTAVGALDLVSRVEVEEGRLEPGGAESLGGPFDVALSRATFDPGLWLELAVGLAPRLLALTARGEAPTHERWAEVGQRQYSAPSSGAPRRVTAYDAH